MLRDITGVTATAPGLPIRSAALPICIGALQFREPSLDGCVSGRQFDGELQERGRIASGRGDALCVVGHDSARFSCCRMRSRMFSTSCVN